MQNQDIIDKRTQTCIERYGVPSVTQVPEILAKRKLNSMSKWGVDSPMKSDSLRERVSKRMLERTVDERVATLEKTRQTCLERFGVEHPMLDSSSAYRQKRDATCLERYGQIVPTKSDVVKAKTQKTCEERFGVPFPMMNSDVKTRMVTSLKKNDLQAIAIRRIDTMKRNNSFQKSRAEDRMYELLIKQFDVKNIERNKRPAGTAWPIDFYVNSIDVWIQVDGVYWHGLDGQLDKHRASSEKRSRVIVYKWETDRKQEAWFTKRNMKLLRFTDKQVLAAKSIDELFRQVAGSATSTS